MLTHKILGVVFDLDNTLVSSSLDFNIIRLAIGSPRNQDILTYVDNLPAVEQRQANELLIEYEMSDALDAKKLKGTDELLALLSSLDLPSAIVTRNCHSAAQLKVTNNDIDIPIILTREDHKAKPAPDSLLYLSNHWNIPTENLLYVGDYLYDLQAANNANTMSCLISYGRSLTFANLANIVVTDLLELCEIVAKR